MLRKALFSRFLPSTTITATTTNFIPYHFVCLIPKNNFQIFDSLDCLTLRIKINPIVWWNFFFSYSGPKNLQSCHHDVLLLLLKQRRKKNCRLLLNWNGLDFVFFSLLRNSYKMTDKKKFTKIKNDCRCCRWMTMKWICFRYGKIKNPTTQFNSMMMMDISVENVYDKEKLSKNHKESRKKICWICKFAFSILGKWIFPHTHTHL